MTFELKLERKARARREEQYLNREKQAGVAEALRAGRRGLEMQAEGWPGPV